jgi:predicted transcriptional regulator
LSDAATLTKIGAHIVAAYVERNTVSPADLPAIIQSTFNALSSLGAPAENAPAAESLRPAVPVRKSVTDDYIVCLEDGKRFKSMRRHLQTMHGLTPDEYRHKWGLAVDYPTTAPSYAKVRSAMAKKIGLGVKSGRGKTARKRK